MASVMSSLTQMKTQKIELNPALPHHTKHWHYLYKKRRRRALGINAKQMAWGQIFSVIGSVIAGLLLESNKVTLAALAGAFVILPGVFDLSGTMGAVLSAKINHRLEDPAAKQLRILISNVLLSLAVTLTAGLLLAAVGASLAIIFFEASFWQVFVLAEASIFLSTLVGFPLVGGLSVLFRRLNINPDDVVGPIESTIFDILTVLTLALVAGWLL